MDSEKLLRSIWLFLAFTFGVSWSAYYVQQNDLTPAFSEYLRTLVQFGPAVGGLVATLYAAGGTGLLELCRRLLPRPRDWRWVALALLLPILVVGMSIGIRGVFQPAMLEPAIVNLPQIASTFGLLLVSRIFLTGGIGEELGWRGFLLPTLLPQFGPFQASLLIGFLQGIWHFPAYGVATVFFVGFTVSMAFIATWLHHKTDGNLVAIVVLHSCGNAAVSLTEQVFPGMSGDIGFVLITFLLWGVIAVRVAQRDPVFKTDVPLI